MSDVHDKETRSYNMSRIRGKNTKPEIIVRKYLFSEGFRYRLNDIKLPGKPDIVLPKYRTVIFVNGCFWHGHQDCKYFVLPKTRTEWWYQKINKTKERDRISHQHLNQLGYNIITVWECQLKPSIREKTLKSIIDLLYKIYLDIFKTQQNQ